MLSAHPLALSALLLSGLPTWLDGCNDPPPPTCEEIQLEVDVFGVATVTNYNAAPIAFSLFISSYRCSGGGCTSHGDYPQASLDPGQSGTYEANIPPEFCTDVWCCADGGFIAHATAELTLLDDGCTLVASADRDTCEGG